MLARSSELVHSLGIKIETPLLVPSFSSKGFAFKKKSKKKDPDVSEVAEALEFSKEFLTESLLVSAYDIYYNHIPFTEDDICTEITILDSGGYETGNSYDLSMTSKFNYDIKNWDVTKLEQMIQSWPEHKAAIIVSYDDGIHRFPLKTQIENAKSLFLKFPSMMSNFLIKPETDGQKYVQIDSILDRIKQMKSFGIIGLTERELGNSTLERMKNISKIREALDKNSIRSPIHIFGSLDPITSILYFLVGAEIFDGLTWLKYSYFNNCAIYTSNFGVLNPDLGIGIRDGQIKSMAISKNTYYLSKMKYTMKNFLKHKDYSLFDTLGAKGFGEIIETSYKTFESNI